ncbi:hypothetical protein BDZ97DRAFT_435078 [Flammula alnicola]|nr:hypothetical protein BDZ97DRAFT_435078 [Flammula alnicola]
MTEYDYSPEAFEAHMRKQQQIARWVDNTNHYPLRNPFTPATPAVNAAAALQRDLEEDEEEEEYSDSKTNRRRDSKDRRDRPRYQERDRDREVRDRERERFERAEKERDSRHSHSSRSHTKRHRSASHSGPTSTRPDTQRSYTVPPPLPLPPYPQQPSPTSVYPQTAPGYQSYPYAPKLISPRDSRHSSRSSSTTRLPQQPSPTSYFPVQQQPPYSAPAYQSRAPPLRSQTTPNYGYPQDSKYPYSTYYQPAYPNVSPTSKQQFDWANAPQYPHAMYQTKPPPLLKRLFMSLTGSGKHQPPHRTPRRKRSSSF